MAVEAEVTFSDGRRAIVSGETREEIQAKVDEYERSLAGQASPQGSAPAQQRPAYAADPNFVGPLPSEEQERGAQALALMPEGTRQRINALQELARIDPSQAESAQLQIDSLVDRALGEQESVLSQFREVASTGYGAGVPLVWAAAKAPVAGVAGLYTLARARFLGATPDYADRASDKAAERVRGIMGWAASDGLTETGETVLRNLAEAILPVDEGAQNVATNMSGGNPYAATAIYTTLMGLPELFGLKIGAARGIRALRSPVTVNRRQMQQFIDANGLPPSAVNWIEPTIQAANRIAPESRAAALTTLIEAMQQAKKVSENTMNAAFAAAQQTKAWVRTQSIADFATATTDDLMSRGYDLAQMPTVQRRLSELANIQEALPSGRPFPQGGPITRVNYNEVELVRRRINQDLNSDLSRSEFSATMNLKKSLQAFIDNEFNQNMISGDPAAIAAWRSATGLAAEHARNFRDNKAIMQLVELEATPEQVRNWIIGASDSLPPANVADTVRRLTSVLGADSDAMVSLRMEFIRGLMEPLLKSEPNFRAFLDNLQRFRTRNPSLLREMNFDTSQLPKLEAYIRSALKTGAEGFWAGIEPYAMISRFGIGHGIAKRGALVRVVASGLRNLVGTVFGARKRAFWNDLIGGRDALIPRNSVAAGAIIAAAAANQFGVNLTQAQEDDIMAQAVATVQQQQLQEPDTAADLASVSRPSPALDQISQMLAGTTTNRAAPTDRGIAANNPMNLRSTGVNWRGSTSDGGEFEAFNTPVNGLRAGMINLRTMMERDNLRTIRDVIGRWAPEHENPTPEYIAFVSEKLGLDPDAELDWNRHVVPLSKAIVEFENGQQPYSDTQYRSAKESI